MMFEVVISQFYTALPIGRVFLNGTVRSSLFHLGEEQISAAIVNVSLKF